MRRGGRGVGRARGGGGEAGVGGGVTLWGGGGGGREAEKEGEGVAVEAKNKGGKGHKKCEAAILVQNLPPGTQCTCFTITKVQILTPEELYARIPQGQRSRGQKRRVLARGGAGFHYYSLVSLLALLVQKRTY